MAGTSRAPNESQDESSRARILIVDDEQSIVDFISLGLRYEGFAVIPAYDGRQALEVARREKPDLVILDWMLPELSGLEVCQVLRGYSEVPIIMLTARDELEDRVSGLNAGADDYLCKPFRFEELLARVRAILRRQLRTGPGKVLQVADLTLNEETREVQRGGEAVQLTATEYELLHLFLSQPKRVFDRQTIINKVWGYDFIGDTNIIEVYIRYLREKIDQREPKLLHTVRGVGYVLKG